MDEAQNVKSSVRSSARMARRIRATHRWCVSGTPIGRRGLEDLFGLVSFLQLQPYDTYHWWRKALHLSMADSSHHLQQLLRRIMWRHSKRHVKGEVKLPPLTQRTLYLTFSPIEVTLALPIVCFTTALTAFASCPVDVFCLFVGGVLQAVFAR
jgi:E3 ubiquitin-protein ligase SHPRH